MGSCIRKQVLQYQNILDECYNLLALCNIQGPKMMVKKKQHKSSTDFGQNQENMQFLSEFDEITQEMKAAAERSYKSFKSFDSQDISKLEGQVRLQAKQLSDHIQDTNIRLIDTMKYLKCQLRNYQTEYGGQWATLLILEVLVSNLKNYTQKHISLKHAQQEDSNVVSKIEILTENNDAHSTTKEERQQNYVDNQQQDQITFFSDNFIRFEIDFIEISQFILNQKYNPFYAQSQNQFMSILLKFSQIHKDPYTSDNIFWLVNQLESDLLKQTRQIIPSSSADAQQNLPAWESIDKEKVKTLSILSETYHATLSKLKSQQNVFHSNQQLKFFTFSLQTIMDFNKILPQQDRCGNKQLVEEIINNFLGIISIFAKQGFVLKNHSTFLTHLFKFFDEVKWDSSLKIERIVNETIAVARFESDAINYNTFLMDCLIIYLQLGKQQQSIDINFQPVNVNNNNPPSSLHEISQGLGNDIPNSQNQQGIIRFENCTHPKVKISAFTLLNMLVIQKDKQLPPLMHSANKIVKCYLENLKEYNQIPDLKKAIQQSFCQYTRQLAPDGSSFSSLLTILSNDIYKFFNSNQPIVQQVNSMNRQSFQGNFQPPPFYKSLSEISNQNHQDNICTQTVNEHAKYISEGLYLILQALDQSAFFTPAHMITDEVINTLIEICKLKQVSQIVFQVISKLIQLKMEPYYSQDNVAAVVQSNNQIQFAINNNSNQINNIDIQNNQIGNGNQNNNDINQLFYQISQNSLLHIFYYSVRCIFNLNFQRESNDEYNTVVYYQYTMHIVNEITKPKNQNKELMKAVFAYLMKLIKETIVYQQQKDNNRLNLLGASGSPDPAYFNSTYNQYSSQALRNVQQNNDNLNNQQAQSIIKHSDTFNITQIAIIQLLTILNKNVSFKDCSPSFQEIISNTIHKGLDHILIIYEDLFKFHNLNIDLQKQQNQNSIIAPQDDVQSKLSELNKNIENSCKQIHEYACILNDAFSNNSILENIQKIANLSGFYPDKDFDELAAEFGRNFRNAMGCIDLNQFNIDDEQSQNISRGSYNNNNNNERSNTNESQGAFEKEDEKFGKALKMLEIINPKSFQAQNIQQ